LEGGHVFLFLSDTAKAKPIEARLQAIDSAAMIICMRRRIGLDLKHPRISWESGEHQYTADLSATTLNDAGAPRRRNERVMR
jgi:hypothetical protein